MDALAKWRALKKALEARGAEFDGRPKMATLIETAENMGLNPHRIINGDPDSVPSEYRGAGKPAPWETPGPFWRL